MKLGIGTVQWGMPYGVSNTQGVPSEEEIRSILRTASLNGISVLDTAAQYGSSEERIGALLESHHSFRIVTKTPAIKTDRITSRQAQEVKESFLASLKRLKQASVEGLLVHHSPDLLADQDGHLWNALQTLKADGLVRKIGISVYTGRELDQLLLRIKPDLVQLPLNVLDQRFLKDGHLAVLKERGIEVHARSIFLQGLLLMEENHWPAFFAPWQSDLKRFHAFLREHRLSPLEGALRFALDNPFIDAVLVGVASLKEFHQLIDTVKKSKHVSADWADIAASDERLLNPARWELASR